MQDDKQVSKRTTCTAGVAADAPCSSRSVTMATCPASQAAHSAVPPSGCKWA
jgi:hypothetical protein